MFRLTILVAVVSFLGFFSSALYYKYQYNGWIALLANYRAYANESFKRCGDIPTPAFVRTGSCPNQQDWTDKPSEMPERYMARLQKSAWAAGIVPLAAFFIFYAGRSIRRISYKTSPIGQTAESFAVLLKTHAAIELIAMMENMTPGAVDQVEQIQDIRKQIELAVADGAITVPESRMLLTQTARLENGVDLDG